jgi:hypothetical protein
MKLVYAALFLLLAGCGKETKAPQSGASDIALESLSVKYEPQTRELLVNGSLERKTASEGTYAGETEFFYFHGPLKAGEPLVDPIHETKLALVCRNEECREFSFSLSLKRLTLAQSVEVKLLRVVEARAELTRNDPLSAADFNNVWTELLRRGVNAERSSVSVGKWADKSYFGIFLAGQPGSRTHWLHLAAPTGSRKLTANYSHEGDLGPVFTVGTEAGSVGSDGPTPWAIAMPGGRVLLQTN